MQHGVTAISFDGDAIAKVIGFQIPGFGREGVDVTVLASTVEMEDPAVIGKWKDAKFDTEWDVDALPALEGATTIEADVIITLSNSKVVKFNAFIKDWVPGEIKAKGGERKQTASFTLTVTGKNPTGETAPVVIEAAA
ncbi:MAG: hypothetical protein RRC34_02900 [Lentisphaeria bacterium]|nr:hypothetical protein [Lentisphaeria bacterium]